jgi:hypothetical protein
MVLINIEIASDPKPLPRLSAWVCVPQKGHLLHELELELIQTHMTQNPLLWVEVGAYAVRKKSGCAGVVWAGAGVRVALVCVLSLKPVWAVWRRQHSLCGAPPQKGHLLHGGVGWHAWCCSPRSPGGYARWLLAPK